MNGLIDEINDDQNKGTDNEDRVILERKNKEEKRKRRGRREESTVLATEVWTNIRNINY